MKKFLSLAIIFVMCLSLLASCSFLPPKDADSLLKRSEKAMADVDNFRASMEMNLDSEVQGSIEGLDIKMSLPITVDMSYDCAGNHVHGNMDMSASMEISVGYGEMKESNSEDMSQSAETYMVISDDEVTSYTNTDNAGWVVSESELGDFIFNISNFTSGGKKNDLFKDATMEKSDDEYIVTLNFEDALENKEFEDFFKDNMASSDNGFGLDWDSLSEAVEGVELVYIFDAETYFLKSVAVEEFEITDVSLMDGVEGMDFDSMSVEDFSMSISMTIEFKDFGEIDEDDVKVPKKVVKSAIPEGEDPYVEPETEPETVKPNNGNNSDFVFYYKGEPLGIPTSYSVFSDDGWYPVNEGEFTFFLCMDHDKYDGAILYLFTNDGSGSEKYVKDNGSDGFSIDLAHCENKPDISFAGIRCGDNYSKVLSVLGEPEDLYSSFDYKSASWEIDYAGKDCTLSITLMNDAVVAFEIYYLG